MNLGFLFAFLTIIFFGSWAVPTKTLKNDPRVQAFWLTAGHLILTGIIFVFLHQTFSWPQFLMPFMAGVLWGIGITAAYFAIKHLGITRAMGTWVPVGIIVSGLWGLIFFGEAARLSLAKLILTLVAIFLLMLAALTVIFSLKDENKLGNYKIGILAAMTVALTHGSFFVPLLTSKLPIFTTFLPLTMGMVATLSLIVIIGKLSVIDKPKNIFRMLSAGFILGGGNYASILTLKFLGVSLGFPLGELGIIVNTFWGMFLFKEVATPKAKALVILGVLIALIGIVTLNFAKH